MIGSNKTNLFMKQLALYLFAATIMVSCNQKQESVEITKEKKEIMIKEEKQKIIEHFRCQISSITLHQRWCVYANTSTIGHRFRRNSKIL